ncbi:MAG TPA: 2Fe-2S iron-sulfur cluster-binding protein [Geminicoccaceae bacterium]
MPRITFITPGGERQEIEAESGLSVMEIARMHDLGIEGACEGSIACATCHVIVDDAYADRLDEASAEEEEMLDLAAGVQRTSRLGCQIVLTDDLDGITVRLPPSA